MKITPKFDFVSGSFDTDEVKMLCLPNDNHGKVELCIKEQGCAWNIPIGCIKLHSRDLYVDFKATIEDATKLGEEIARRWNEFKDWHECKEETDDVPEINSYCLLRIEYLLDGENYTDYVTSTWGTFGWSEDNLEYFKSCEEWKITHWKQINKPKGTKR